MLPYRVERPPDGHRVRLSLLSPKLEFRIPGIRGSLDRLSQKAKSFSRPKLRIRKPADEEPTNLADEADRILDKISKHGEGSLTKREVRLMQIYSEKLRKRKKE